MDKCFDQLKKTIMSFLPACKNYQNVKVLSVLLNSVGSNANGRLRY